MYIVGFMTMRLLIQPDIFFTKCVVLFVVTEYKNSKTSPQSADDFERLILSSPNSSVCWIKYTAFHL
jgi:hypothetical protein